MTHDLLPILTARCQIRGFTEGDLEAFTRYRADPEVARYQSWSSYSMEEAREFYEEQLRTEFGAEGTWYQVAIADRESDALLGDCALHFLDSQQIEIGFTLAREHQGRGIMREALSAMLDAVFGQLRRHRVIAITDARNAAAGKLLASLGFRREGHFVEASFFKGEWGDEFLHACLSREWKARR